MNVVRTFLAIAANAAVRRRAEELIALLRASRAAVKWAAPATMHVTLQFLGDVHDQQLPRMIAAVREAAALAAPFELRLHGAGAFPRIERPRILFLGAADDDGRAAAEALYAMLGEAIAPLGFPPEDRPYHPHLTLGRVRDRGAAALRRLSELLEAQSDFAGGTVPVDEVVVFSSQLRPSGPVYEVLARAPLGG